MEPQSHVRVYNDALGVKGAKGKLLQVHPEGYYEISLEVKERYHRAFVPINATVLLEAEPMVETESITVDRY